MNDNVMVSTRSWLALPMAGALCLALAACGAFFRDDVAAESEGSQNGGSLISAAAVPGLSLIAGNVGGLGSVNAAIAINARFYSPAAIAADGSGNLYVVDAYSYTVRKITSAGVVTTLAGTAGSTGSAEGTGAAARFDTPYSVAADPAGNVYVSDTDNNTIRRIVPATGVVTTFAGAAEISGSADGTGAAAQFLVPGGVVSDASGNLYVADTSNNSIRKVTPAGVVTTVASGFSLPYEIATDGVGKLYVADSNSRTIREVVIASGVVTTLAGATGAAGSTDGIGTAARFSAPRGITADGLGNLYVADRNNHAIRKIVIATGVVTTLAGMAGAPGNTDGAGTAARFNFPTGMASDASGNVYVADTGNHTIRKIVAANGVVTTVAGVAGQSGVSLGDLPGSLIFPRGVTSIDANTLVVTTANGVVRIVLP